MKKVSSISRSGLLTRTPTESPFVIFGNVLSSQLPLMVNAMSVSSSSSARDSELIVFFVSESVIMAFFGISCTAYAPISSEISVWKLSGN